MPASLKHPRAQAYAALLEHHWIDPSQSSPAAETALEHLTGARPIKRFALIIRSGLANGSAYEVEADHENYLAAMNAAGETLNDALALRVPVEIVNLDTGDRWQPQYAATAWIASPKRPEHPRPEPAPMRLDRSNTDYQPLPGTDKQDWRPLSQLCAAINAAGFKAATHHGQIHTEQAFVDAWTKASARYKSIPLSGARMRKLVDRTVEITKREATQ